MQVKFIKECCRESHVFYLSGDRYIFAERSQKQSFKAARTPSYLRDIFCGNKNMTENKIKLYKSVVRQSRSHMRVTPEQKHRKQIS